MPKIPSLPNLTAPDSADLLPIEDVSANTTKKLTLANLLAWLGINIGWNKFNETLTRVSTTQYTIPADYTDRLAVGNKLWMVSNGSLYYAYIKSFSFAAGVTTVNTTLSTDYTLAAGTLTGYWSSADSPNGFPKAFNFTPSYGASGSMTFTSVTTTMAKFVMKGAAVKVWYNFFGTTGGSASNVINATIPIDTSFNATGADFGGGDLRLNDSAAVSGAQYIDTSSTQRIFVTKYDNSNWGLGAGRAIRGTVEYLV